jgi:putative proteasome-type protease
MTPRKPQMGHAAVTSPHRIPQSFAMTYCVAMRLDEGVLFASDSRTNAGIDHIATFRKMTVFELPGERMIVLLNSGNLATTQSVVSLLRQRLSEDVPNLYKVPNLYEAAQLVGRTVKEIMARDAEGPGSHNQGVDFGCSFLIGGQIRGERCRIFQIYAEGNFIESSADTPYLQIGEAKYGKPMIDRVVQRDTSLAEAAKCALISFDSTIRSNLSVGLPIDMVLYRCDSFAPANPQRIDVDDPYFDKLRRGWGEGLRKVFAKLPEADWFDQQPKPGPKPSLSP